MEVLLILVAIVGGALFLRRYFSEPDGRSNETQIGNGRRDAWSPASNSAPPPNDSAQSPPDSHSLTAEVADGSAERKLLRSLWQASTLNYAVYGPGGVEELSELIKQRAPELRGTLWGPHQIMSFEEPRLTLYGAFLTGPQGSVFVLTNGTTDGPADTDRLFDVFPFFELNDYPVPTTSGDGYWRTTLFVEGSTTEEELAVMMLDSSVYPVGMLRGFVDVADGSSLPAGLARELLGGGWRVSSERPGFTILGTNVQTTPTRTQVVMFGNDGPDTFRWSSAIAATPDRYQEFLDANIDLPERYELQSPTQNNEKGWINIKAELRAELTVDEVNRVAVELATFADRVEADLWGDDVL